MDFIYDLLTEYDVDITIAELLSYVIMGLIIVALCIVVNLITRKVILRILARLIKKNKFKWDNIMFERKVFHKLSNVAPGIILYACAPIFEEIQVVIQRGALIYIFLVAISVTNAFLASVDEIYRTYPVSKAKPIKGYLQVVKIFVYIIVAIIIISNLMGENPIYLLSGLGALTAVLTLVFKDPLLGLVAGIQLTSNDMIRIGDWIEMPKHGVDGDVMDISLNTVKVQNFDKTIVTIPTYALVSDSFINWRGMQVSGGRRIKRSIYIDTSSIGFCSEEMIERFKKIHYLTDYILEKEKEIKQYNIDHKANADLLINGRQLTNIGTFRAYIQACLKNNPHLHKDMAQMVRQLPSGPNGVPLEVYTFSNDIGWANYEAIQADIFDHILAVVGQFGLRIYQSPSGYDFNPSSALNPGIALNGISALKK